MSTDTGNKKVKIRSKLLVLNPAYSDRKREVFFRKLNKWVTVADILANPIMYLRNYDCSWLFNNTKEELEALTKLDPYKVAKGTIKIKIE